MEVEVDKKPLIEVEKFTGTLILPSIRTCSESYIVKYLFCCFYKNYSLNNQEKKTLNNLNKLLGGKYNKSKDNVILNYFHSILIEEYKIHDKNDTSIWKKIGFQVSSKRIIFNKYKLF